MLEGRNATNIRELDVAKLFRVFVKYLWYIALYAAVGASLIVFYLTRMTPETYTASALVYVYQNNPNQVNYQYTDSTALNTAARLMETYMVVIRSNKVMDAVSASLGHQYDPEFIAGSISVGAVAETEVMRIRATTTDPILSTDICNAVAKYAPGEIARVVNAGQVEVIDYATVPPSPDNKNVPTNALMGACAGAALACVILSILFLRDFHVRGETDITDHFEPPLLACVPNAGWMMRHQKRNRGRKVSSPGKPLLAQPRLKGKLDRYIISERMPSEIVEIYNLFRTRVFASLASADKNVVLVTSSIPSEGKSTISTNLAIVTAHGGHKVLIIDADMRKPALASHFGVIGTKIGLSDVLTDISLFDQAVTRSVRPNLDLLTSGKTPHNPIGLLELPNLPYLMDRLSSIYDWIIIDTPPTNVVADALVLSNQASGAVFVARRNVSNRKEIYQSLLAAKEVGMNVIGFVLTNARSLQTRSYSHRYRYYHTYGIQYQDVSSEKLAQRGTRSHSRNRLAAASGQDDEAERTRHAWNRGGKQNG